MAQPERLSDTALRLVDRYRYWLFAGIVLIFLAGFNGQWRVERDSALYLTIGRNLAEGHGATYRGLQNHLVFPGLPYLLDATFRTFHTESLLPPIVLMLLLGFVTLGLCYRLFLLYAGRPTAVVMTVGLGMTRLFYRYCFEILTDLPFLLGVMAFLAGYEAIFYRRPVRGNEGEAETETGPSRAHWYDWALLIGGLVVAITMRPVMWALLAAVVLALGWRAVRGRINRLHVGVTVLAIGAVALFYFVGPGRHGATTGVDDYEITILNRIRDFHATLAQIPHNFRELFPKAALVKAVFGCKLWPVLNVGLGVLIFVLALTLFYRRALWGFLVMINFAMLLLFQQPLDRYFVCVIPLLIFSWWQFLVWLNHKLPANWGNWCFLALFFGGLGCNIARIGEMVVEQRGRPFLAHYHDGRYESLERAAPWIAANTTDEDWILAASDQGRILTFKTRRNVMEPTEKIAVDPKHLYVLVGPSWQDLKDGQKKVKAADEPPRKHRRVSTWLSERGLELGESIRAPFNAPADHNPWILYRVVPAPAK
ncbi:MAG TPA: hypothetical protein VFE47_16295 [Tepidisphaeraceae bacterium]|nr:hypothetical protein [Tepidisphaeraceae bacterium]